MLQSKRKLIVLGVAMLVGVLSLMTQAGRADAGMSPGYTVSGCWWATVYFGDPSDPSTATNPMIANLNVDGTLTWSSVSHWGDHPYMPGQKAGAHGTWKRQGLDIETKGLWFDELGGGAGISLGRAMSSVTFRGPDEMVGYADFDFVPCPAGTMGCTDPTQGPFLQMGEGLGPFPIVFRRLR